MPELTAQTKRMIEFVGGNPSSAKANAVIISAWNELGDGHRICPSLKDGPAKLQAVKACTISSKSWNFESNPV